MLPLRSISMLVVGLVSLFMALGAALSPEMVSAEFGAGWLYVRFGLAGIVGVLAAMGSVFTIWGGVGMRQALMQRRSRNDPTE